MISIIILGNKKNLTDALIQNIKETIGCEYEIVLIENSLSKLGICEGYNLAAKKSLYNYLVFAHEDMLFHTKNWGKILLNTLSIVKIGIVGGAGSTFKSNYPTAWGDVNSKYFVQSAIASWKKNDPFFGYKSSGVTKVAVLDGFFMCMRKDVWKETLFNQDDLKGFHLYDVDLCIAIGEKHDIVVTHDIITEHFSPGNFNKMWFLDCIKIHKERKKFLPISVGIINKSEITEIQYSCLRKSINYFLKFKIKDKILWYYVVKLFIYKPFNKTNFRILFNLISNNFKFYHSK